MSLGTASWEGSGGDGTEDRQTDVCGRWDQLSSPGPGPCGSHGRETLFTSSSTHPTELLSSSRLLGRRAHGGEGTATVLSGVSRAVHAGALGNQQKCCSAEVFVFLYGENNALLRESYPVLLSQQYPTDLSTMFESILGHTESQQNVA